MAAIEPTAGLIDRFERSDADNDDSSRVSIAIIDEWRVGWLGIVGGFDAGIVLAIHVCVIILVSDSDKRTLLHKKKKKE